MATVDAADSWQSLDGRVLAFEAHVARFSRAVEFSGGDATAAEAAMRAAREATPAAGAFFPRVDFADGRFERDIRPDPRLDDAAVLWTSPNDPRTTPAVKGPDLPALAELNAEAAEAGATEAVLLSFDGEVIEGAFSAMCWWRGDTLCYPDEDLERIDSVTWRTVKRLAAADGVRMSPEFSQPADLEGCEVWIMNARHGIRPVTSWVGGPPLADLTRASVWRARLDTLREGVMQ
ncbi:MAG: aminotransferase class IV [Agrococcus casei]|uniref:aminotransferase class IV n=1 Tax=Agrococcus casei TaxID=343512 RepID=UPI003F9470B0